jgi:hypothetical protein
MLPVSLSTLAGQNKSIAIVTLQPPIKEHTCSLQKLARRVTRIHWQILLLDFGKGTGSWTWNSSATTFTAGLGYVPLAKHASRLARVRRGLPEVRLDCIRNSVRTIYCRYILPRMRVRIL